MCTMNRLISFFIALVIGTAAFASETKWNGRVFKLNGRQELTFPQLTQELATNRIIILGENHSTKEVQDMEANIISNVVKLQELSGNFTIAWEFLNVKDQEKIQEQFGLLKEEKISMQDFINTVVGGNFYSTYAPVIENAVKSSGQLLGINLSREQKQPVSRGGLSAADPSVIPPGYETGSANYLTRFKAEMGDHTPDDKLMNYFDAQCLTDDVMAFHALKNLNTSKTFLIAGHFHTDYNDGVVQRLRSRAPNVLSANVRIVDASEYATDDELTNMMSDSQYGDVADYVVYVKEPKAFANK